MNQNLLSFSKVTDKNKAISSGNFSKMYNENNKLVAVAEKKDNLYFMKSSILKNNYKNVNFNTVENNQMSLQEKWHRTLGHVNFKYFEKLCKDELLQGLPKVIEPEFMKCATCIESKMSNLSFKNNAKKANDT